MISNSSDKKYILQSVDNALRIIDFLSKKDEVNTTEISNELKLGKSSVFRLLKTLSGRYFIYKNPENNKYKLGLNLANIGTIVLKRINIITVAHPYLRLLSEKFNETSHLSILGESQNAIFIDKVEGSLAIKMDSHVGMQIPAYCTGTGKILLAYLNGQDLTKYCLKTNFTKYTKNTIVNPDKLKKELKKIKIMGYATDIEEKEIGLMCVAAPIKNGMNKTIASISISGPYFRMNLKCDKIINEVKNTAKLISKKMGHKDWL